MPDEPSIRPPTPRPQAQHHAGAPPSGRDPASPAGVVAEVASYEFPIVLRGYDRLAVDRYVERVTEIVRELEASGSPEAAIKQALEQVGGEVADILKRAHATATEVTSRARAEADELLGSSRAEAERLLAQARAEVQPALESARREAEDLLSAARAEAESLVARATSEADRRRRAARAEVDSIEAEGQRRIGEIDADADRVWGERQRILDDVRELAARLEALADSAVEQFPPDDDDEPVEATDARPAARNEAPPAVDEAARTVPLPRPATAAGSEAPTVARTTPPGR